MPLRAALLVLSMASAIVTGQRPVTTSMVASPAPIPNLLESSKPCDYTSVAPTFLPYLADIQKCTADSNYSFVPPVAYPTAEQTQALCTKPSCTSALASIQSLALPNCTISVPNAGPTPLDALIRRIAASCQPPTTTTATTTTPASTSAVVVPATTSTSDGTATVVPLATAKSSASMAIATPIIVALTAALIHV